MPYQLLVVDDEKIYRNSLAGLISRELPQFQVLQAANGLEALRLMEQTPIHCMFLDIRMPKMDGMELLHEMERRGIPRIDTVIVSGYSDFTYARTAIQHGVFDYLLKPITPKEAVNLAKKLLQRAQEQDQQHRQEQRQRENMDQIRPLLRVQAYNALMDEMLAVQKVWEQLRLLGVELDNQQLSVVAAILPEGTTGDAMENLCKELEVIPGALGVFSENRLGLICNTDAQTQLEELLKQTLRENEYPDVIHAGQVTALQLPARFRDIMACVETSVRAQVQHYSHATALVQRYVEEHYAEAISNTELASILGYSSNYLAQVFKSETGMGLNEYIRDVRIDHAKQLLRRTAYRVTEISAIVGFSSNQYFTTVFRRRVGMTPLEYREEKIREKVK